VMWPFLLMVSLAAVAMGILNARHVFGVPALAAAFFNVGSIVGGLGCASWFAPQYMTDIARAVWQGGTALPRDPVAATQAITGMAIGTLLGGVLQLLVQLPAVLRTGFRYEFRLGWRDPALRRVLRLMGPATIGAAAVQINVFVNNNFASYLGDGPVSWLNVAFRFMQLPIGLFGVAIGTVTLPEVARQAARGELDGLRQTLRNALTLLATLCIPAAMGLHVLRVPVIGLLYEHGRFHASDTLAAATALSGYALGLAGYAGIKVLAPAFYALNDARTPALISLVSIATNYLLNWTLVRQFGFGHAGLALSTSAVATLNFGLLYFLLRRRIGPLGGALPTMLLRIVTAVLAMGTAITVLDGWLVSSVGPHGPLSYAVRLVAGGGLGVCVFWLGCVALSVPVPRPRRR
jgi:putative peptidoglycan lipid II flippase